MKVYLLFFLSFIAFFCCDKKPVEAKFCQNCDLKTDALTVIENKPGWIIFLSEYNQYAIEVSHYNDPIIYLPCKMPTYFQPVEMATVVFSGKVLEDPYLSGDIIKTTYYCIKLDTIHSISPK